MYLFWCLVALAGEAEEVEVFIASDNVLSAEGVRPSLEIASEIPLGEHWGFATFSKVSEEMSEGYVGPVWKPNERFSLGLSAGFETAPPMWRVALTAMYNKKDFEGLLILEHGISGPWYRLDLTERIRVLKFGLTARHREGAGVRVGIIKDGFEVWAAPLYDVEAKEMNGLAVISWLH
jgi:hypothetical protein